MRVRFAKSVLKQFRRMPKAQAERFRKAFAKLAEIPARTDLDIQPLVGQPGFRLRIGKWRALFQIDTVSETITVRSVGPRGDIYKA